jgi:hypothetical protein
LSLLLCGLRCSLTLLHHFVDRECLAKQPLALRCLHRGTTDLWIASHHDRKSLRLAARGVGHKHCILDRHEGREQLAHLLDLDPRVKIADVDLEHWHGRNSRQR